MSPIPYLASSNDCFPDVLRRIPDAPQGLYYRIGSIESPADSLNELNSLLQKPFVAIVGTRKMTTYGAAVIRELVPALVRSGCVIVSGLALGCDGEAHAAALDAGGFTAAVMAGGITDEDIYPRTHLPLARNLLRSGGVLLSEFPAGTTTYKSHFPHRNRIIAGLCSATIVIEGELQSGSMITGKLAAEFGRTVFAVPGPIHAPYSTGTNHLIQCGAFLYTGPQDVLQVLGLPTRANTQHAPSQSLAPDLAVLHTLLVEPRDFHTLVQLSGQASTTLMTNLTLLELRGLISKVGGCWIRASI